MSVPAARETRKLIKGDGRGGKKRENEEGERLNVSLGFRQKHLSFWSTVITQPLKK